jgi:hypothetical protein
MLDMSRTSKAEVLLNWIPMAFLVLVCDLYFFNLYFSIMHVLALLIPELCDVCTPLFPLSPYLLACACSRRCRLYSTGRHNVVVLVSRSDCCKVIGL